MHGTISSYTNGRCRCDDCRRAMRTYTAARRARFKNDPSRIPSWAHGTEGGYVNYSCRCDRCRAEHTRYTRVANHLKGIHIPGRRAYWRQREEQR